MDMEMSRPPPFLAAAVVGLGGIKAFFITVND